MVKKLIVTSLLVLGTLSAQSQNPPQPKHYKWHKFTAKVKHDAKVTAEVAGVTVILAVVVLGSGGANVKVY